MTERASVALHFIWRTLIAAFITAFITLMLAFLLGASQRSLAQRVDGNTARILAIIEENRQTRNASLDALFCVIASGDFTQAGVDTCLSVNEVPQTYELP